MKKQFIRLVRTLLVLTILSLPVVMLAQTNMGMGNFNDCGPNDYYDDGGSATNYNDGQYYVETYCGAQPGDCIQFDFQSWDVLSRESLTIYDGPNTSSPFIGYFDDITAPGLIVATTGCLTFEWSSSASGNATGWHAIYSCVPCAGPTCSDGIQNQGETGIDCGGPCPPCCPCSASPARPFLLSPPSVSWTSPPAAAAQPATAQGFKDSGCSGICYHRVRRRS